MNELDQQLAELVKKAISAAEKTGKFVIDQAPELLQEFYRWHVTSSVLGILLGVFLLSIPYPLFKAIGSKKPRDGYSFENIKLLGKYYTDIDLLIYSIIALLLSVGGCVAFFENVYKLAFILTAPKIYLIEYFLK